MVFLMAIGRLRSLSERLIKMAGYPRETEVGIVEKVSQFVGFLRCFFLINLTN